MRGSAPETGWSGRRRRPQVIEALAEGDRVGRLVVRRDLLARDRLVVYGEGELLAAREAAPNRDAHGLGGAGRDLADLPAPLERLGSPADPVVDDDPLLVVRALVLHLDVARERAGPGHRVGRRA